ncbi:formin-like 2 domain-containing protein [Aureococcus anophagefferens]|nr:formin-like 2 domain-containing protein [Aureococcus anophagefferens]
MAAPPGPPPQPPKPRRRGDSDSESEAESEGGGFGFGAALRNEQRELLARTLRLEAAVSAHAADDQLRAKRAVADAAWRHEASLESARQPLLKREALALGARAAAVATSLRSKPAPPGCAGAERRGARRPRGGVVAKLRAVVDAPPEARPAARVDVAAATLDLVLAAAPEGDPPPMARRRPPPRKGALTVAAATHRLGAALLGVDDHDAAEARLAEARRLRVAAAGDECDAVVESDLWLAKAAAARERWSACFRRAARSYQAARHLEANARGDDARRAQALRVAAVRAAQLVEAAARARGRLAAKVGGDGDAADPIRAFTTFEVRDALAAPGCSLDESQRAVLKTALDYGWLASTAVSGAVEAPCTTSRLRRGARMFLAHCYGAEAARQRGDARAATAAIDCIKRMFHFDPKRDRAGEEGGHGHDGHGGGRGDGTERHKARGAKRARGGIGAGAGGAGGVGAGAGAGGAELGRMRAAPAGAGAGGAPPALALAATAAAARAWEAAAAGGDAEAAYNLGVCYETGRGVAQDAERAAALYDQAARRAAGAQRNLGCCYEDGSGVEADLQRARRNWALAAAQGHEAAREALGDTGGGADIASAPRASAAAAAAPERRRRRRAAAATQDGLLYHLDNPAHRRVKPVFMTGAELWKLFRPKALAAGLFPMLLKHAGRRRAEEAERQRLEEEKRKKEAEERAKAAAAGGGGEAATKAEKQPKKPAVEKYDGPKMKQLYWSKLDNVEGTVFAGGGGDDAHDASVLGDLLEHFGPQAAKVVVKEAKPKKPKAVQLLDPKRVQNLNIVLAQFKDLKSADELVRALEDCDAAHLTADNCAGLAEHCPEAAECEACAAYLESGGDPALLGRADKFCAAVAPLQKTLRARLDAIRAKLTYDEDAQAIRDDAKVLSWAAEQAKSSDKLKRIMLLLLKLGNALNRGTARGGASGIKLDALQQMGRTKTNGGITLLRYVVERVEPREPELLELRRDMPDVAAAKRKNLDQMKQDFAKIKAAVAKTGATLKVAAKAGDQKLLRAVGPWHRDAALDLDALERELDAARSDVHDAQEEKKAKEKASRKAAKQAMHQDPHRPL